MKFPKLKIKKPKIFWTLDEKIASIGYKVREKNVTGERINMIAYEKVDTRYGFQQSRYIEQTYIKTVVIERSGFRFIVRACDTNIPTTGADGFMAVGLSEKEMKLFYKKQKQLNRKFGEM